MIILPTLVQLRYPVSMVSQHLRYIQNLTPYDHKFTILCMYNITMHMYKAMVLQVRYKPVQLIVILFIEQCKVSSVELIVKLVNQLGEFLQW